MLFHPKKVPSIGFDFLFKHFSADCIRTIWFLVNENKLRDVILLVFLVLKFSMRLFHFYVRSTN